MLAKSRSLNRFVSIIGMASKMATTEPIPAIPFKLPVPTAATGRPGAPPAPVLAIIDATEAIRP